MEYRMQDGILVARLDDGEDLVQAILSLCDHPGVPPTLLLVSGLGMLSNVELGYFTGKGYEKHAFKGPVELVALSGAIFKEAEPRYHFHAVLGLPDSTCRGGHLFAAKVENTLELFFVTSNLSVRRAQRGLLRLMSFD